MKKNTAALVLAILGSIAGLIGGIMWATCADTCANIVGSSTIYTICFIVLGIGGAVLSLIGGIQAFRFKSGRLGLSVVGLLCQIANLVLECVFIKGFSFILSIWTLLAVILLLVATFLAAKEPPEEE
ncbi:MAG: hypothetical protein K2N74_01135 [Clostridiales bacterium]|nr:hypothetical protein [Clostridiales bacterium]